MRELSDVNQLRDATETATDRLVHLQRRRTSCTPAPPLGPRARRHASRNFLRYAGQHAVNKAIDTRAEREDVAEIVTRRLSEFWGSRAESDLSASSR